jgi:NAD(P)-dependent dehydrogenase (short-subunit alcohol dehydrogenase family)
MTKQSAIITGAAKRVGRALAIGLAERGFDVALHYQRSEQEAHQTKEQIEKLGRKCVLLKCDLTKPKELLDLIGQAHEKLENLELLVNNASIFEPVDFLKTDLDLFQRNFAIHVQAPFFLTAEFTKICKHGNVINIIDTMITKTRVDYFAYLLSKKTLDEFTKLAARALAPKIRVNAIAPGSTAEPIDEPDSNYMQRRANEIPLKMPGNPSYLLQGIDFLLGNPFVTGECLFIDGGAHIES